ncbi:MAG TPA: hypothetical protein VGS19_17390 [Streptosporangiaceae bacterium]|nr:hypothetical protein [Streptosporangiaceae bacterium]
MDEATCHPDPSAEAAAEQALAATGRTLIVIAHRVSSARQAQRILLLDGNSATTGSHEELLALSSLYDELVGIGTLIHTRKTSANTARLSAHKLMSPLGQARAGHRRYLNGAAAPTILQA